MHILIGLAVATVLIIIWARGNLFACVFLSIPTGLGLWVIIADHAGNPKALLQALLCVALLAGIWAPRYYYLHRT